MTAATNEMSLSVVIPTLNEAASVRFAIESAIAAKIDDIIVVDGGSNDDTTAIAESLGVRVVMSCPGRGIQMNRGATETAGDLILFLHADCFLPETTLEAVRGCFCSSDVVAAGFRQAISESAFRYRILERGNRLRVERLGWVYGDQALVVRRTAFERVGRYPDIPLMEDLELSKRLKRIGRIAVIDDELRVDARRWKRRGVVSQTLRNWMFVLMYHLGVSPERLAKWYRQVR